MLSRTRPLWVYAGGFFLTFMAGLANAVGLLGLAHSTVTHVTGTATLSGIRAAQGDFKSALAASAVLFFFFFGAALSGVIIRGGTLRPGRRYGAALLLESALIFGAWWLFRQGDVTGEYVVATAFGLQNALATSYSGAVLRTTHLTGVVTDLGLMVGHALIRQPVVWVRFWILLNLLCGFVFGAGAGALTFDLFRYDALLIPASAIGLAGAAYWLWRLKVARSEAAEAADHDG